MLKVFSYAKYQLLLNRNETDSMTEFFIREKGNIKETVAL